MFRSVGLYIRTSSSFSLRNLCFVGEMGDPQGSGAQQRRGEGKEDVMLHS
jgi:hypothetical protein